MLRPFSSAAAQPELEKLIIFDTTLRDGEQSPGATLTGDEKVDIGKQLARLGVDVCEAGFPIASQGDFEAVTRVAQTAGQIVEGRPSGLPMRIAGLARANEKDLTRCAEAVSHAPLHRIHTFLASSDIHLEHKLNMSRQECLAQASKMVAFARTLVDDIEFSPEDAGRSDPDFLVELCQAVIEAGATTINLPDTVGYTLPQEYGSLFAYLIAKTPVGDRNIVWSTHCHNDLGLATANSLAAVQQGARQVEVTLNSLGERAGNTSLEEVVMALRTRPQVRCRRRRHAPPALASGTRPLTHARRSLGHSRPHSLSLPRSLLTSYLHPACAALPCLLRHRHEADHAHVQDGERVHGHLGAAEQGHRRRQRLRAREWHPPARHAQECEHLRDHDARVGRHRVGDADSF